MRRLLPPRVGAYLLDRFPAIPSPGKLIQISLRMITRDPMIDTHPSALDECSERLRRIGVSTGRWNGKLLLAVDYTVMSREC
jgi:hypothetical protein